MSTYIRASTVLVRVNVGPPTWWAPKASVRLGRVTHIDFGWLRLAVQIGIGSTRLPELQERHP